MGSSKKGSDQEVFDYLMSIDYGVCYGPVDQWNQIWVKDKPIWCGSVVEQTAVSVNQPELFGGDTSEGGVVGTVEVYMGNDTQQCSSQLAGRVGLTPDTMPGYRGLAHLFFRGDLGNEEPVEQTSGGAFATIIDALLGLGFSDYKARGFRWSTNNAYLPEMKVNLTRVPKELDANKFIYPPIIDENGDLADDPNGAIQAIDGLPMIPNLQGSVPIWTGYDYYIIRDQAIAPYAILDFDNFTDTELDKAAEAGWTPTLKIDINVSYEDASNVAISSVNHRFRMYKFDGDGNIVGTASDEDVEVLAAESIVIQKEIVLDPSVRRVEYVMTASTNGNDIAFTQSGSSRSVEIFFTDTQSITLFDENISFTDGISHSHASNGKVFDVEAVFGAQAIADGLVSFRAFAQIVAQETGLGGGDGEAFTGALHATGFGANGDGSINYSDIISLYDPNTNPPSGTFTNKDIAAADNVGYDSQSTYALVLRPGTKYVSFYVHAVRLSPVLSYWSLRRGWSLVTGPSKITGKVHCEVDKTLGILPDANPAQMIYECMTNTDWGKGEDPAMMNQQTFIDAATTLEAEYFGLSMAWFKQDTIEKFVQEILDHIQAFLYQDPATGLWELKLLRDDYDIDAALTVNETNADLRSPKRKAWGETINEIVVSYTDAQTEENATVSAHNLGNIAMQGGIVSETRDYYGIRNPILAQIVADRDVEAAGYPVLTCQAVVDRTFWRVRPGDVVKLTWADEGLTNAVMRVMGIDYGSPSNREIVLELSEDIFALEQTSYTNAQGSLLDTDQEVEAEPMDAEIAITAPLPYLVKQGGVIEDIDADDPVVAGLLMADHLPRPLGVQVHTEVVKGNGDTVVEEITSLPVSRSVLLEAALVPEATSTIPAALISAVMQGNEEVGDLLMLGLTEADSELVMLDELNSAADPVTWTVLRGVWDTVPIDWPIGARLWQFPPGTSRADPGERTSGETRSFRYLPRTSYNSLPYAEASDVTITYTDRPFAPFRPADFELDGTGFAGVDYSAGATGGAALPATITASWVNRNRTTEDAVANSWTDIDLTPEVGTTIILRFYDTEGVYSHEITGLTGTFHDIPIASFAPLEQGTIQCVSERDGIRSLWGLHLPFDIRQAGYGLAYGYGYGG